MESTVVAIVVAFIGASGAIIAALIQTRKEKKEQPSGIHLVKPLPAIRNGAEAQWNKYLVFAPGILLAIIALCILSSALSQDYFKPSDCDHIDAFSNPTGYEICINSMIEQNEATRAKSQLLLMTSTICCGAAVLVSIAGLVAFSRRNKKAEH